MTRLSIEAYLARLYTDASARNDFLADPAGHSRNAGLSDTDVIALQVIDKAGLQMAAKSYANKRAQHRRPRQTLYETLTKWWSKWAMSKTKI